MGLSSIIKASAFHFADFKLTNYDSTRIASVFESMILQGMLTRQRKFDRQWLGAFMVAKMVRALYEESLEGVCNWDIALAKIQNMVLVSALGCRVGDITKGQRDRHNLPYLCYGDIQMKLIGGGTVDDLVMVVLLRNNKGCK